MGKRLLQVCLCLLLISSFLSSEVSAVASDTYAHKSLRGGENVSYLTREMYSPVLSLTAESIGMSEELDGMTDICTDESENVYILCGETSRLVILNNDYSFKKDLKICSKTGDIIDYTGAKGIFISKNNEIYIADTNNARLLVCNMDGILQRTIEKPKSPLIPKDFMYQPTKVIIDKRGYTYILSLGSYYGALTFSPKGDFVGFLGSNTVNANALDTIGYLWDKLTGTDAKRQLSSKSLPYSFVDFCIDYDGYMITCSMDEDINKNGKGQIRKITFNGSNILYNKQDKGQTITSEGVNFLENKPYNYQEIDYGQRFCSIDVDSYGFIYVLDETFGLIYVCDSDCNVINIFGGGYQTGNQMGVFNIPSTLCIKGNSLLVADKGKLSITVYDITEYGSLLKKAQNLYLNGKYQDAAPFWQKVISLDRGSQLAYSGLAMAAFYQKDYSLAIKYAKSGVDYKVYDLARQEIIRDSLSKNFMWLFPFIIVVISSCIFLIVKLKKKRLVIVSNKKIMLSINSTFHPFNSFLDIKQNKQGSWIISGVITFLLYLAFTLKETQSGFLFSNTNPASYNMIYTFFQTVGLLFLWSISNWLICSLFSGKGSFQDVFVTTTYSLIPLIIFTFIYTICSHFLSLTAMSVMDGIQVAIWMYTFFLIIVAMITVHEFDFFHFILTGIVVVFFMIIIAFVAFMFIMLLSQVTGFGADIYEEVVFR